MGVIIKFNIFWHIGLQQFFFEISFSISSFFVITRLGGLIFNLNNTIKKQFKKSNFKE